jgi:hypothetical protein
MEDEMHLHYQSYKITLSAPLEVLLVYGCR